MSDVTHNATGSICGMSLPKVVDSTLKVLIWYSAAACVEL